MGFQDLDRPLTEFHSAIFTGLCHVALHAMHTRLGDRQDAVGVVEVAHDERDLFRWTQPGEEAERIVVRLRSAPITL